VPPHSFRMSYPPHRPVHQSPFRNSLMWLKVPALPRRCSTAIPDKVTYIVEEMGGGCAFFDYDNDGWMDIFIVGGRTLEGIPPGASNRLYKNNRDGTFTDVTERPACSMQVGAWALCWRLQQRWLRRSLRHLLRPEQALSQQWRRHLHRCHRQSRPIARWNALRLRLHLHRLQP
jgi:hypothetical protein